MDKRLAIMLKISGAEVWADAEKTIIAPMSFEYKYAIWNGSSIYAPRDGELYKECYACILDGIFCSSENILDLIKERHISCDKLILY